MRGGSANNENESTETPWPSVLQIASSEEFQQSFAVAQLAFRMWEANKTSNVKSIEKASPKDFLADAWELVQRARKHVVRPQTNAEYLEAHGGSDEAMEDVNGRMLQSSLIAFKNLCDPNYETKDDDVKPIEHFDAETGVTHKVDWKVYRSKRGFDDLFWAWWRETSILKLRMILSPEAPGSAPDKWEEYGQSVLDSWKKNGVPFNTVLALDKFRREHDKRAVNLKPKPKAKRTLRAVKSRKH